MTPPDALLADREIREGMHALELAPLEVPFALIDAQADQLRTRGRYKIVVAVAAALVVLVAVISLLPVAHAHRAVRVEEPTRHGRRVHNSTPTTTHAITTTSTIPRAFGSKQPHTQLSVVVIDPAPTTVPLHQSTPTTRGSAPQTTPTTIADQTPTYPPIQPGYQRLTIVLDDNGLHAPATASVNGGALEVLFLDQRTHPGTTAFVLDDPTTFVLESWSTDPDLSGGITTPTLTPGVYHLKAQTADLQDIPGATVTITFTA